jgi:hypothetical protein
MAITQALCLSYKQEILQGLHLSTNDYYIALYTSAATLNKSTTTYTGVLNEVSSVGTNYTTGGKLLVGFTTNLINDTAIIDFTTDPEWLASTITARGALIYNDSLAGKNAVAVLEFGGIDYTSTNGSFKITFPVAGEATALIRIV